MPLAAPHTLARIMVVILYLLVFMIGYRWLFPGLSSTAKKLAIIVLAAHTLVMAIGMQSAIYETYLLRLFNVLRERNLATAVAGMQLALVAQLALATAWYMRGRSPARLIYLVCFSLLFFYLAFDELLLLHEFIARWEFVYAALGLFVAAVTTVVMLRSPRRARIWYLSLIAGLAIGGTGATVMDRMQDIPNCAQLGTVLGVSFLDGDQCVLFLVEESMEFIGVWIVLVGMLGMLSDAVARPNLRLRWLLYALPVVSLVVCVSISDPDLERVQGKTQATPADVAFESGVQLYGYQVERRLYENSLEISLWLSALPFGYDGLGYSIHLLDPLTAASYASRDEFVSVTGSRVRGSWYLPVFRQSLALDTLESTPRNQALLVVLTAWRAAGDRFARLNVVSSDHELLSETQVILGEMVLSPEAAAPAVAPLATFDSGLTLGVVDLPHQAQAGETLAISFSWRAENEVAEDYVQFLHIGHEETGEWQVYDQQPLGARLPTRHWYSGLADSEIWTIDLPADFAPGRYRLFTGLYRVSDRARLLAYDADGKPFVDARVPLGSLVIERA